MVEIGEDALDSRPGQTPEASVTVHRPHLHEAAATDEMVEEAG